MTPPVAEGLVTAARRSVVLGLNQGTSGNISVRQADGAFLISPSGIRLDALQAADLVSLSLAGEPEPGRASSEWRLHRDIYRARPDVGAVLHTHSRFATTLACLRQELPAVHYLIATAGTGVVRCSRYATFGTAALSDAAVSALGSAGACLLANHGLVAVGATPDQALEVACEVEAVAEWYWRASAIGTPILLDDKEMEDALARFHDYRAGRTKQSP